MLRNSNETAGKMQFLMAHAILLQKISKTLCEGWRFRRLLHPLEHSTHRIKTKNKQANNNTAGKKIKRKQCEQIQIKKPASQSCHTVATT